MLSGNRKADDPAAAPLEAPASWRFEYAIGGRFLSQPQTGVQRYAAQVVRGLDDLLSETNGRASMFSPRLQESPNYRAIDVCSAARTSGHLWEQLEFPLRARRPLLSLCNIGPLMAAEHILCIHDTNVFRCPESYSRSFRLLYRTLGPQLARRAARLTTVSNAARQDLAEVFDVSQDKITVLPNGHEHVRDWRPERSVLADEVSRFRPFILLLGSTARHKNIGHVLSLAPTLAEDGVDIVVAGGAGSIFTNAAVGGGENVHVLGRVSDDDLALLYQRALCLAFPSRAEGFGLPLLEAMALRCPVIAANIPSSLEVCGDAALFAAPDDGEAWLDALRRLLRFAPLREELTERGRARANLYTWRETARGYFELGNG